MLDRPPAQPATLDDVLAEVRELRAPFEAHVGVADDSDEMSVLAVAVLVRKSTVTVRAWCTKHNIGRYDLKTDRYFVSRRKLRVYLVNRFGSAPDELGS